MYGRQTAGIEEHLRPSELIKFRFGFGLVKFIKRSKYSINQSFICSEQYKKTSKCTIQCRTGHKGMKHLQVPETKPNNKNTIKNVNDGAVRRPMIT